MNHPVEDLSKDLPSLLNNGVMMSHANQEILIFKGIYILKTANIEIEIDGEIWFMWLPDFKARFYGNPLVNIDFYNLTLLIDRKEIVINGEVFGDVSGVDVKTGLGVIEGRISISNTSYLGDISQMVDRITFSIPNLKEFIGLPVKYKSENNTVSISQSRIFLEDGEYQIIIDRCSNYSDLHTSLKANGGYIIQYNGELRKKNGLLNYDDGREVLHCLNRFLHLLNGINTSAIFLKGWKSSILKWEDYTPYVVRPYKYVYSWSTIDTFEHIGHTWNKFRKYWLSIDDRSILISIIHWYVEANINSAFIEGSIVMAQAALEGLFNWIIIENDPAVNAVLAKKLENKNAEAKLFLLLKKIELKNGIPESLSHLVGIKPRIKNGPTAIIEIRNALVHGNRGKRRNLNLINSDVRIEVLRLSLWYIELLLLHALEYDSKYFNRCSQSFPNGMPEPLPWSNTHT